jgi:hypothetical protein
MIVPLRTQVIAGGGKIDFRPAEKEAKKRTLNLTQRNDTAEKEAKKRTRV